MGWGVHVSVDGGGGGGGDACVCGWGGGAGRSPPPPPPKVSFCMDLFDTHFHQICDGLLNALRGRRSSY